MTEYSVGGGRRLIFFCRQSAEEIGDLPVDGEDLLLKLSGRETEDPRMDGRELDEAVGGDHTGGHAALVAVHGSFQIGVGGFMGGGVDDTVTVSLLLVTIPLDAIVCIEDQRQVGLGVGHVVVEDVHQRLPGGVKILPGQIPQVLPGEDDIVAVHQQLFLAAG